MPTAKSSRETGTSSTVERSGTALPEEKARRIAALDIPPAGKLLDPNSIVRVLQQLIRPGDRVALEGNNQKQADFLSRALVQVDPNVVRDIHLLISTISRPEHLTLLQRGLARKLDF